MHLIRLNSVKHVECERRSRFCVCTIATGDAGKRQWLLSRRSQQNYARKIGADYLVIDDPSQPWVLAEKFRVGAVARQYQRTLYLDADVFVANDAPNVFDFVDPDSIGLNRVDPFLENNDWWKREITELCATID